MLKFFISILTVLVVFIYGFENKPLFSYAFSISGNYITDQYPFSGNTLTYDNGDTLTVSSTSPDYVYAVAYKLSNSNYFGIAVYSLGYDTFRNRVYFSGSTSTGANIPNNNIGNSTYNLTYNFDGIDYIISYNYFERFYFTYRRISDFGGIPFVDTTSPSNAIHEMLGRGVILDDLGYLKNVGYHVDSYGLEHNPIGTNELVSWASESTTGIDLTQDKYQVEFALRDTSTHVDKNMYDSFLSSSPYVGLNAGPVSVSAWGLTDFIGVTGKYFASFFAPSGSDAQAYLRGQAVRSSLYGKTASVGTFSAKNLKASLNGISVYKNYFRDYPESNTMKSYIDSVGSSPTRSDFYNNAFNYFKNFGADTYLSYDIMARIVDSSNGNKGEWLVINKHNTPYISSDSENRLINGVTLQPSIINNFNPTVNNFADTPDITINPDIDFRPIIKVGYVKAQPDVNIEEGDIFTINNNYEYDYEGDSIVNDIDEITNITNIYEDNTGDGGGSGDVSDTKTDLGGIKQGLIIARKFIRSLVGWFRKIFNPFLPIWAQNVVIIALPITTIGIIWKMIKPLLQFLGRDVIPLLLEFFGGIPRLPG